ncbi:DNA mismatch repair protein [Escherichia coli]|nr:DNA mismatch repair protein [Escherichia coli]
MSQPRPLLSPPETEEQLLAQAQQLSGYTLGELAALVGLVTPENLKRDKRLDWRVTGDLARCQRRE